MTCREIWSLKTADQTYAVFVWVAIKLVRNWWIHWRRTTCNFWEQFFCKYSMVHNFIDFMMLQNNIISKWGHQLSFLHVLPFITIYLASMDAPLPFVWTISRWTSSFYFVSCILSGKYYECSIFHEHTIYMHLMQIVNSLCSPASTIAAPCHNL